MDLAVIGLGALGAATLRAAARAGARCLGIDARPPGHAEGSSHGGSRIIRRALFEHPDYVAIVSRAYELWAQLEESSERHVFDARTGLLLGGRAEGALISGTLAVAREHGLSIETLTPEESSARFPLFRLPEGQELLFDPDGGILRPEQAVLAQVEEALAHGAELRTGQMLVSWRREGEAFSLELAGERLHARRLALCPGPWARELLGLELPLRLLRKVLLWHLPSAPGWRLGGTPMFAFESGPSLLYGFPALDERGVKIADHGGGSEVMAPEEGLAVGEEDLRIEALRRRLLVGLEEGIAERATCLYTSTPDGHPIVGEHPEEPGVFIAAGFSGHGFKHSIALGEAIAALALEGRTSLPLGLFDPSRFSRRGPRPPA